MIWKGLKLAPRLSALCDMRAMAGAALLVLMLWAAPAHAAELPAATESALKSSDLIYVATRRRDGTQSSVKPIWFFYQGGGKLFFTTSPGSWKARRIAAGSPLYIWVGKQDGPFLLGTAQRVDDAALVDKMGQAYADKYWIAWLGFFRPRSGRVSGGQTVAYEVALRPGTPP